MKTLLLFCLLGAAFSKPIQGANFKFMDKSLKIFVEDAIPAEGVKSLDRSEYYETFMRPIGGDRKADYSKRVLVRKDQRLDLLKEILDLANKIEMLTYNPYLTASFSIPPMVDEHSDHIAQVTRQISVQEMLHVGLACNLLLAVGGTPHLHTGAADSAPYNYPLMDIFNDCDERNYEVLPASQFQLKQFFRIESEQIKVAIDIDGMPFIYLGISQVYHEIDRMMIELETSANDIGGSIFLNQNRFEQLGKQFNPNTAYFFQDNSFILVKDIETALMATNLITWQGESVGIPIDGLDGPNHAEIFFLAMVEIFNNPVVTYDFTIPQDEALMIPLNARLLEAQNIITNTVPLVVEKIALVNEFTISGAKLKRQLMATELRAPSNLSTNMAIWADIVKLMASRGVLPDFSFHHYNPNSTPKTEMLDSLRRARNQAYADGDESALMMIDSWINDIEMFFIDFPLVGYPEPVRPHLPFP